MPRSQRDIIGRCGYICGRCLAYRGNVKSEADGKRFRDGLARYYRYPLSVEACYCDGCLADSRRKPILLTPDCPVRACVVKKRLVNCASCDKYPCKILEKKFIAGNSVVNKIRRADPQEGLRPLRRSLRE